MRKGVWWEILSSYNIAAGGWTKAWELYESASEGAEEKKVCASYAEEEN